MTGRATPGDKILFFFIVVYTLVTVGPSCICLPLKFSPATLCKYDFVFLGKAVSEDDPVHPDLTAEKTYTVAVHELFWIKGRFRPRKSLKVKTFSEHECGIRFQLNTAYVFALTYIKGNWRTISCDPNKQWVPLSNAQKEFLPVLSRSCPRPKIKQQKKTM